jgi:hypothetical protein
MSEGGVGSPSLKVTDQSEMGFRESLLRDDSGGWLKV